jgi:hypothetical protein
LEGHNFEVPFSEFGPRSFAVIRKVEDGRPSKSRLFIGLKLMACGRNGLSIDEVDDYNRCRRAQWKGAQGGWEMKYEGGSSIIYKSSRRIDLTVSIINIRNRLLIFI